MDGMEAVGPALSPVAVGSLLLIIALIILYLKPKSTIQGSSLKPPKSAVSLEAPPTPGKPTVRILYGTQASGHRRRHGAAQRPSQASDQRQEAFGAACSTLGGAFGDAAEMQHQLLLLLPHTHLGRQG